MISLMDEAAPTMGAVECDWTEALEDFLRGCRGALEEKTTVFYRERLSLLIRWCAERQPPISLARFQARHMREYLEARAHDGWPHPGRLASPKTRKHDRSCARVFFDFCIDQGYYSSPNPMGKVAVPKVPKPYLKMPTDEELHTLLQCVLDRWNPLKNPACRYTPPTRRAFYAARDHCLFTGLICTGARVGELLALTLEDFQPDHSHRDEKGRKVRAPRILIRESKGDEPRVVPIPDRWVREVRAWLKARQGVVRWWKGSDHLFVNKRGEPLNVNSFGKHFRVYRAFAEQSGYRLHDFRHYAGTQFAKVNPMLCRDILGHRNLNTSEAYIHRDEEYNRRKALEADPLGKVLRPR